MTRSGFGRPGVGPTAVVLGHPFPQDPAEMSLVVWDEPVQTSPTQSSDQAFTKSVGLRRPDGRFQHPHAYRRDRAVDGGCVHGIAIVNQESIPGVAGDHGAKLLQGPFGGRMSGSRLSPNVEMRPLRNV